MVWTRNSNESSYESPNLLANIDIIKSYEKCHFSQRNSQGLQGLQAPGIGLHLHLFFYFATHD